MEKKTKKNNEKKTGQDREMRTGCCYVVDPCGCLDYVNACCC